ncbi:MAG: RHS repeat protein [Candidatus Eremiobacteraeota bacterium]|nr:RHS repeat protein [Candidatus Eremiobacteraeota bacterium]
MTNKGNRQLREGSYYILRDSPSQTSEIDANGKTTTGEYDEIGRLIKVTYNDDSNTRTNRQF